MAESLRGGGGWLGPEETLGLLECYGLPVVRTRFVEATRRRRRQPPRSSACRSR